MIRYEFSAEASRIVWSEIRELLAWSRRADTISFGGGLPDPSLLPVTDLKRICAEVLGEGVDFVIGRAGIDRAALPASSGAGA